MEPSESTFEVNWSSTNAAMSVEESDIMAQLLSSYSYENESDYNASLGIPSLFGFDHDVESSYCFDNVNSSLYCWPQGNTSTTCSNLFVSPSNFASYYFSGSDVVPAINTSSMSNFCMVEQSNGASLQVVPEHQLKESDFLNQETCSANMEEPGLNALEPVIPLDPKCSTKRKIQLPKLGKPAIHDKENNPTEGRKKKARASVSVQKNGRNAVSKKDQKSVDAEKSIAALNGQASSSYSSEDDSGASQEVNGGVASSSIKDSNALKLNGKTRAGRCSATDPQSLYARKRRERINERLKILQNLVPNGTKVDISTMLEEAVQYVKFLQLQIKILSSDDLWMYAPIAYNGMDIGLDLKISLPQ